MLKLLIVRHGESLANKNGLVAGDSQSPLSAAGIKQAHALANKLQKSSVDLVITSDRPRALETAQIIAKALQLQVNIDPLLREKDWGVLSEAILSDYEDKLGDSNCSYHEFVPSGGESFLDVQKRVGLFCEKTLWRISNKSVLIVGHDSINKVLLKLLLGLSWDDMASINQPNACINELHINSSRIAEPLMIGSLVHLNGV